jgi:hemerythrin-like metal-binding protein
MAADREHYQQTGFEPMDAEHAQISLGLERLLQAVSATQRVEATAVLAPLANQIALHFAHEERLMTESGYPLARRHREAHDGFVRDVNEFLLELKTAGLTEPFRRWATGRALEWFRFHIAANDVGLGHFLLAREAAQRAAAPVAAG